MLRQTVLCPCRSEFAGGQLPLQPFQLISRPFFPACCRWCSRTGCFPKSFPVGARTQLLEPGWTPAVAPCWQRGWWSSCTTGKEGRGRHGYCSPFCLPQNFSFRHAGVTPIYVSPGVVLVGCFLALACNDFVDRTVMQLNYCLNPQKEEANWDIKGNPNFWVGFLHHLMSWHHVLFCKHKREALTWKINLNKS